ncbi:Clp protease N-terminal domain-containing protein [Streptomyces sp. NPDC057430]|uniref:Clp protease N-terminal domain-containing protein n=1 Tax=Streptomyces sp. NPDC057430 TaxID=3346131 RepID=UPI0036973414
MERSDEPWTLEDLARLPISDQARVVWNRAIDAAHAMGAQTVTADHLWWAVTQDSQAREILARMNASEKAEGPAGRIASALSKDVHETVRPPTMLAPELTPVWRWAIKQSPAPWVSTAQLVAGLIGQPTLPLIDPSPRPDPGFWGDYPSEGAIAEAEQLNSVHLRKRLKKFRHGSLGPARAARLLAATTREHWHPKDIISLIESGNAVAFQEVGKWRLPAWQFTDKGLLPGLADLQEAFPGGAIALSAWATRPSAEFSGRTPREMLDAGETEAVVRLAKSLMAAAW